ncbi:BEN domain-containing protein 5-like isoform X3 [Amblyomma americanum]
MSCFCRRLLHCSDALKQKYLTWKHVQLLRTARELQGGKISWRMTILCQSTVHLRALGAAHGVLQREGMQSLWSCPFQFKMKHRQLSSHKFHLTAGIIISGGQASKIMSNKKPSLVCKDTAQAVWGNEVLATRSFSGAVAPKQRALGEKPKQPLTPHKVDVVIATMKHWGTVKGVDVSEAVWNVPRMLTEKIQDVKKALRKVDSLNSFKE